MDTFTDEQLRYRIALAAVKGMKRVLAETLVELTGDVSSFFTLSQRELVELTGWQSSLFSEVERGRALMIAAKKWHSFARTTSPPCSLPMPTTPSDSSSAKMPP